MLTVSSWIVDLTLSSPCSLSFHYKNLRADFRWRPSCTVRNFYVLISVGSIYSFTWITSEGMWLWLTFIHLYVSSWPVGYRYFFYLMKLVVSYLTKVYTTDCSQANSGVSLILTRFINFLLSDEKSICAPGVEFLGTLGILNNQMLLKFLSSSSIKHACLLCLVI